MSNFESMTAFEIARSVRTGEVSALEVTQDSLRLAETRGRELNAFITVCREKALQQAADIDRTLAEGSGDAARPLLGVPVAVKDNICLRDCPTTCASRMLRDFVPPYDATVVTRLLDAGAVIIGKTNMDEFGMGSSSEHSCFGSVRNPLGEDLVPGGSSGGSAAAVAAGVVPVAYGSDTGGSIRQPAAFCGIQGLKPTYGAVSRYGLVAFASSFDQIGPLARNSRDMALAMQPIMGHDPHDATSLACESDSLLPDDPASRQFRIGLPGEYFRDGRLTAPLESLREALTRQGHTFVDISLPLTDKAIACYYIIANAEASTNLARYDGVRYGRRERSDDIKEMYAISRSAGFGEEVKRRIMLGTFALSTGCYDQYYRRATAVRQMIREEFARAFESVDLIMTPTTPTPPFKFGERIDDPLAMYLSDVCTVSANLAGIPAISTPIPGTGDELPEAVQFMAPAFGERELLNIASVVENLEGN